MGAGPRATSRVTANESCEHSAHLLRLCAWPQPRALRSVHVHDPLRASKTWPQGFGGSAPAWHLSWCSERRH